MSDMITHWAVFDEAMKLVRLDRRTDRALLAIVDSQVDAARLGAITRFGSAWVPKLLAQTHPARDNLDDTAKRRVAFAFGGVAHYPADEVLKPLMSKLARVDWEAAHHDMQKGGGGAISVREISAYYDCCVFREVYGDGVVEPFSPAMFARMPAGVAGVEQLVRTLFQRALLACHTFNPGHDDPVAAIDQLLAKIQPLYLDLGLYARVYAEPDPRKIDTFGVHTHFYVRSDPTIVLLERVRAGQGASQDELEQATSRGVNSGGYAQAVAMAVRVLAQVSDFWAGRRDAPPDVTQIKAGEA
jgi:hypothetical protein